MYYYYFDLFRIFWRNYCENKKNENNETITMYECFVQKQNRNDYHMYFTIYSNF